MMLHCVHGEGTVQVNSRKMALRADDLLFLPWDRRIVYRAGVVSPFLLAGVHIVPWHDPTVPLSFSVPHRAAQSHANVPYRSDRELGSLEGIVELTLNGSDDPLASMTSLAIDDYLGGDFDSQLANAWARLLLAKLHARVTGQSTAVHDSNRSEPRLAAVEHFVRRNLSRKLTLGQMADAAGMSVSSLRRLFVSQLGTTPYAWVTDQRMRVAAQRILTATNPIGEIARDTGFADAAHFSKVFRGRYGMTPREYRRRRAGI